MLKPMLYCVEREIVAGAILLDFAHRHRLDQAEIEAMIAVGKPGDPAFDAFYAGSVQRLTGQLYAMTGSRAEAEDDDPEDQRGDERRPSSLLVRSARRAFPTFEQPRQFVAAIRDIVACYAAAVGLFTMGILLRAWH